MNIGKTIAKLRAEKSVSQQQLAELLFVSRDLVSKWENGTRRPNYGTIETIARFFDVSVDTILNKEDLIFDELSECFPESISITDDELADILNTFLHGLNKRKIGVFNYRY